jgi:uncharacterized protein involved in tolerance to divalent cations
MIQITLYTDTEEMAKSIGESLLKNKLVAYISIDMNNHFYTIDKDNQLVAESHSVLKAMTRALLFAKVEEHIQNHFGEHIKIFATPIALSNQDFSNYIRQTVPVRQDIE